MTISRRRILVSLASIGIVERPYLARGAAPWPGAKPIAYVVPFTPGGTTDTLGRALTAKLSAALGQSFVVENRPGAGGGLGAAYVASSVPDGYTLLAGTISTNAINASLYRNLPYDPIRSFEPVSLVATVPNVLMVASELGVATVDGLIALLRRVETRRSFASSGAGTSAHLAGELFAETIGVPLTHVPYKGTSPALIDVAAGRVTFMFDQMTAAMSLVQDGRLKLLAVTASKRLPLAPEVPTMVEAGIPGFVMSSWQAVYAPRHTPRAVIDPLSAAIADAARGPDMRQRFAAVGVEMVGSSPAELAALTESEVARWAEVVKRSGITVN